MTEEVKKTNESCPYDDPPKETPKVEAPKVEVKTEQPKQEEIPQYIKDLQTQMVSISGNIEKINTLSTQLGVTKPQPTATVSNEDEPFSLEKAAEKFGKWVHGTRETACNIEIPLDYIRDRNIGKVKTARGVKEVYRNPNLSSLPHKITEALGFTGTQTDSDQDLEVLTEPGGLSFVPTTQYARVKEPVTGQDKARFWKADFPATGTQTAGTTTTEGTMDLEAVEITPSTITGTHFKINTDNIEDKPVDLLSLTVDRSALLYEDFISTDMLDTVSKEGTLTPGLWIRGDTGAIVTSSDTASVTLDPTGIGKARAYLQDKGYLRGGVRPVCFLDPEQALELIEDSEISNFTQFAVPEITRSGNIDMFYGTDLVVTNTIEHKGAQTTNAHNAIMCVPNHSYGIGIKRNVTVKFHEIPEDNQIRAVVNWRAKSGVLDATSIVRISTTNA